MIAFEIRFRGGQSKTWGPWLLVTRPGAPLQLAINVALSLRLRSEDRVQIRVAR